MEPEPHHHAVTHPLSATALRKEWTPALRAVANTDAFVQIERYRTTVAFIVPAWWHRHAVRVAPPLGLIREIGAEVARREISELLTATAEHGQHCIITIGSYRVAALVPGSWAADARAAMNLPGSSPTDIPRRSRRPLKAPPEDTRP